MVSSAAGGEDLAIKSVPSNPSDRWLRPRFHLEVTFLLAAK
jgi:hypothetical protein